MLQVQVKVNKHTFSLAFSLVQFVFDRNLDNTNIVCFQKRNLDNTNIVCSPKRVMSRFCCECRFVMAVL